MKMTQEISLKDYFNTLVKRRKVFPIFFLSFTILATIISFVVDEIYFSESTIIPINTSNSGLSNLLPAGVSSLIGNLNIGQDTGQNAFLIDILESRTVAENTINTTGIKKILLEDLWDEKAQKWEEENEALLNLKARMAFKDIIVIDESDTGLIKVGVYLPDPKLAARTANEIINQLRMYLDTNSLSTGKSHRLFVEEQLKEVQKSLLDAENDLLLYQQEHGIFEPTMQAESTISIVANLEAELINSNFRLEFLRRTEPTNSPKIKRALRERETLQEQLNNMAMPAESNGDNKPKSGEGSKVTRRTTNENGVVIPFKQLPELGLEFGRKKRAFLIQEKVYEFMIQQYEIAKVEEARNEINFQVVDEAIPAARRSSPRRGLNVVLAAILSVLAAFFYIYLEEYYQRLKAADQLPWSDLKRSA